ncbi:hypothetical protein Droror1_Dr00025411 [Drosera rotundifolia]
MDSLKMKVGLYARGIGTDDLCMFCRRAPEDHDHLFVACAFTAQRRQLVLKHLKLQCRILHDWNEWSVWLMKEPRGKIGEPHGDPVKMISAADYGRPGGVDVGSDR